MNDDFNQKNPPQIADIMSLPDEQRQIVNWIIHQQKVSLTEVVNHTNLSEDLVQQHLQNLVDKGFIAEFNNEGLSYYQPQLGSKQKSRLPKHIWDKLKYD